MVFPVHNLMIRKASILYILLVAFPIISYILVVVYFSKNIPYWDDYDTVLAYLNEDALARSQVLFHQHNEHRIFWNRLVVEGYYFLFRDIDFKNLIFLGNLGLLLFVLIFFNLFKSQSVEIVLFVPILYLIFQPQSWENITWATASLQNHYIILFAFMSFYLWNKERYIGYIFAVLFGVLAAYTSANGMLVLFIIFFWEILKTIIDYKNQNYSSVFSRLKLLSFLLITITFMCLLYLKNYTSPDPHRSFIKNLLSYNFLSQYILIFLGSFVGINKITASLFGLLQLVLFFYITYSKYYQRNPVNYLLFIFLLLSAFMIALGRLDFGVEQALSSRYRIISILFLVVLYFAIAEIWPRILLKKPILVAIIIFSFLFNIGSQIFSFKYLTERKEALEKIKEWPQTGKGLNYPNQERANLIMKHSVKKGVYRPSGLEEARY